MQALLWTPCCLKHHSIRRHHEALLKTVFPQLPYFYPLFKGLLRAVSGTRYTSRKRWKNSSPILKKGPSLEHVYQIFKTGSCFPEAETISSHFKTAGLLTAALGYHSPLGTGNSSIRHSNRVFSPFLYFAVWNLLPCKATSRQFSSEISTKIKWPWWLRQPGQDLLTFWHVIQGPCVCFRPDVWIWARSITWHSLHIALWLLDGAWLRVCLPFTGKGQTD